MEKQSFLLCNFVVGRIATKQKLRILLNVENLLAVIITANLANAMRKNHLIALGVRALYQTGSGQLGIVRTSGISASLGYFTLWYCHLDTSYLCTPSKTGTNSIGKLQPI